jgi:transcriptional regulator with XRE-family HTH domain
VTRDERKPHVLRTLRQRYGLSQSKLAALIGRATITVKLVESGRLKVSPELAHRIFMVTGLDPGQLIENFLPEEPMDPMQFPLTSATFAWRKEARKDAQSEKHVEESLNHYTEVLRLLLDASIRDRKLWALRPALQNAINKLIKGFDLGDEVETLLKERWGIGDLWSNASPSASLYVLANADLSQGIREKAQRVRAEFFEVKRIKKQGVIKPRPKTESPSKVSKKKV